MFGNISSNITKSFRALYQPILEVTGLASKNTVFKNTTLKSAYFKNTVLNGGKNAIDASQLVVAQQEVLPKLVKSANLKLKEVIEYRSKLYGIVSEQKMSVHVILNELIDSKTVIMPPGHDHIGEETDAPRTIADSLSTVLNTLKVNEKISDFQTAIIPIQQSNTYFGLQKRHFTWLKLEKSEISNTITATHYDSKGLIVGSLYSLDPIKKAIQNCFDGYSIKFNAIYSGMQGMLDDINCGRYTFDGINNYVDQEGFIEVDKEDSKGYHNNHYSSCNNNESMECATAFAGDSYVTVNNNYE
ncbi:hypothetical protein OCHUTO_0203 [Orientia chuto str. Dubai]|uniref:Uncharacterized protein n=1 Tax=Orientia chuto str. Dubai TaxID=1359168 RepID=A0A0F3MR86_9RICK|nr:hypothetical protein [Candidatus Orientia mediorientalis]KJV57099.1 hypothetical protein OCHUTO_0203 [Orientia chuto str. Dubai]